MDAILLVTSLILIFIIAIVYVLNTVNKTTSLQPLYEELLKQRPSTISFCLGKNTSTGKYTNVVLDKNLALKTQENDYPVDLEGKYIILKEHGDVTELPAGNGFKISGIDLVEFTCPDGFEGINCKLQALCGEDDAGKYKALTYTQFNELHLYTGGEFTNISRSVEPTHPRIRIYCTNSAGDYELQTCPNNTLLDTNLNCEPYDICEDRINGYKHNYKISSTSADLAKNQYYICDNNVSVLTTCSDDTVFSASNFGCISESVCYNLGNSTIAVDDNSYIQCNNDVGTKVTCKDGVETDDSGTISCVVDTCVPETFSFSDDVLSYNYGQTICTNGVADTVLCDQTLNPRVYNYEWADKFTYTLADWPTEIMDSNRKCVAPDDTIIVNPLIELQWTDAMTTANEYNILTEKYICPDDTTYVIDYKNQVVNPTPTGIIDHFSPCQNDILNVSNMDFTLYTPDFPTLSIVMYTNMYIYSPNLYPNAAFWPKKVNSSYICTDLSYTSTALVMTNYTSSTIPLGFLDPTSTTNTELLYSRYQTMSRTKNQYFYFLDTGAVARPDLYDKTVASTYTVTIDSAPSTTESKQFAIDLRKIATAGVKFATTPACEFYPTHFIIDGTTYQAGYLTLSIVTISPASDTGTSSARLNIGGIASVSIPSSLTTLEFY
ncbi:OrNV vp91-like protein [Tomelloso virus]|uniref:OrNV vp91-like protein n=1 Tax=Tomelloso virus TaxID=2053981 RepID=A0A2H4T2M8_9VIRU|nr:OrNV vp91-like protein [Tomelloso virus]ATY70183.1 OrNV vp91-like protein [Tomelloso virus]